MRITALLFTVAVFLAAVPAALSCTLLSVSAGPVDANVAGTVAVHVAPIAANVDLDGLLGSIVCPIIGG